MKPTKFDIPEKDDTAFASVLVKVASVVAILSIVAAVVSASAIDGPRFVDATDDAQSHARRNAPTATILPAPNTGVAIREEAPTR